MMNSKSFPRLIFTALLLSVMITACDKVKKSREPKMAHADSVIFDVGTAKDYERMRALSDSFELTKDISSSMPTVGVVSPTIVRDSIGWQRFTIGRPWRATSSRNKTW